jgi:hypothetical protein
MVGQLLVLLGFVTILLVMYTLIARSAGIFPTQRHFWRNTLISAVLSYGLSSALFWFFHTPIVGAFIIATIVPFIIGNFDGAERGKSAEEIGDAADEPDTALEKNGNAMADAAIAEEQD